MKHSTKGWYVAVALIGIAAIHATAPPKIYTVSHTEDEWAAFVNGQSQVLNVIHSSDLPAHTAFYCDSVLNAQSRDIYQQVMAQKMAEADTLKKKGAKQ